MTRSLLPPRKRDWTPGTYQIGVFLRTKDGAVLECVMDTRANVTEAEVQAALALIKREHKEKTP